MSEDELSLMDGTLTLVQEVALVGGAAIWIAADFSHAAGLFILAGLIQVASMWLYRKNLRNEARAKGKRHG